VNILIIGVCVCVCTLLLFVVLYSCRLHYLMCVFHYCLQILCLYSNTVSCYLEQSIRNTQPVVTVRLKEIFQFIQEGPSEVFDQFDSVFFPDAKLEEEVMSYTCRHRLVSRHERQLINCPLCVLKQVLRYDKVLRLW
jgi:hypothetical protein